MKMLPKKHYFKKKKNLRIILPYKFAFKNPSIM